MRRRIDAEVTRRTIDFMKRQARAEKPFYAYVPFTQVHFPTLPHPDFAGKTGYGDFADNRRLPDADIAILRKWFEAGMPQGEMAEAPKAPIYDATWQLGKPDLILKQAQPFTVPAGGTDVFRNFILPYPLKEGHFIRAMEIRPGAPQIGRFRSGASAPALPIRRFRRGTPQTGGALQTGSVRFRGRLMAYSSRRLMSVRRDTPRSSAAFAWLPLER